MRLTGAGLITSKVYQRVVRRTSLWRGGGLQLNDGPCRKSHYSGHLENEQWWWPSRKGQREEPQTENGKWKMENEKRNAEKVPVQEGPKP